MVMNWLTILLPVFLKMRTREKWTQAAEFNGIPPHNPTPKYKNSGLFWDIIYDQ